MNIHQESGNNGNSPGGVFWFEITRAEALVLIASNTVVKGAGYLITDKNIVLYGDDENAFKLEGSLIVNVTTQDVVHYDILNDLIVYRKDKNGNELTCINGIGNFPFNTVNVSDNKITGKFNLIDSGGTFKDNLIICDGLFPSTVDNGTGIFVKNIIQVSTFDFEFCNLLFSNNTIKGNTVNFIFVTGQITSVYVNCASFNGTSNINISINRCSFVSQQLIIFSSNCTANECNIASKGIINIVLPSQTVQSINYIGVANYDLKDYNSIDPSLEGDFSFIGSDFSLGTKTTSANTVLINTTDGSSLFTFNNANPVSDASIIVWSTSSSIEYATGINLTTFPFPKNIKLWNRSGSDKYIIFEKQNGNPFKVGQFFSEVENVITLRSNEYIEFQLCTTYKELPTNKYYLLISTSSEKVKRDVTFEGNVLAPRFRSTTTGVGNSVNTINPSPTEPYTKGSINLGPLLGATINYSDSNNGTIPTISTTSNSPKFLKIRARQLSIIANVVYRIGFVSGITAGVGEGATGFSLTAGGFISTQHDQSGNPSVVTDILPLVNLSSDTNWHEFTVIITSQRIIYLYDNKIVQVTNQKPTTAFNFSRGVILGRGGTPGAYSLLIENFLYSDL